jgi:hypothetical protein
MADPQKKLEKLVSEAVSNRLDQLKDSLTEEIAATLAGVVSAAEEKAAAAEEQLGQFEKEVKEAEKRAKEAEKTAKDAEERVEKLEEKLEKAKAKKSEPEYAPGAAPTDLLNAAVATIADAGSQADILKATLDGIAQFAARTALYVVKGGQLTGWQSRGFADEGAIKGSQLSASDGLAGRAMNDREPVSAAAAEFDQDFVNTHGNPADGNATVLPLVVREKVSALVYVDAGAEGRSDLSAVRVMVRTAAMWLEILALRKLAGAAGEAEAPAAVASAAVAEPAPTPEPPPMAAAAAAPAPSAPASAPTAGGPDLSGLSSEDQEVHKKAKRFAKLLVDEIKLYNQKKVEEGKKNRDLYSRLKEDIDKSRQTYEKRWGSSAAGSANYFQSELVRILADNDAALMGAGF